MLEADLKELLGFIKQIRIEGLRGDGTNYPWKEWDKNTIQWFNELSQKDKDELKKGKIFQVRSFFCCIEEIRCVPNSKIEEK